VTVLASALCPRAEVDEPILRTVASGKVRVVRTPMGHDVAVSCVGFLAAMQRSAEWAAAGEVTVLIPDDFPGADKVKLAPDGRKEARPAAQRHGRSAGAAPRPRPQRPRREQSGSDGWPQATRPSRSDGSVAPATRAS
jgi:hypothetical protein